MPERQKMRCYHLIGEHTIGDLRDMLFGVYSSKSMVNFEAMPFAKNLEISRDISVVCSDE